MIIGSLSALAVNTQDIGVNPVAAGSVASVSSGSVAASASAPTSAETASATIGAGYISPFGRFDYTSHLEILQFRNSDTGKVTLQIPSERVVDAYRRSGAVTGLQQPQQKQATEVAADTGYPVPAATTVPRAPNVDYAAAPASADQQSPAASPVVARPAAAATGTAATTPAPAPVAVTINVGTPAVGAAIVGPAPVAEPKPATGGSSAAA